ncbi:isochorismatase family protein [Arthrobacter sp. 7Tela_A1]|uniref:isochorismatase family protein n=1 Tax=Arthrobacter sp. 7Tela_A1 TaxID=3093745 RepID=UPI003BB7F6BD
MAGATAAPAADQHPRQADFGADFAAAGLDGTLGPGERPALLLVDPAAAYTEEESPLYAGVQDAVTGMHRLLAAARRHKIPVFLTRVLHEHPGDGGLFARKVPATRVWAKGSPWAEFIPGLEPGTGETVITKQYPSAFFGTPLASLLSAARVDTVLIAGLTTSGCIRATALDALQHGFIPIVAADAVGDRHPEIHASNLVDIKAKIADVETTAGIERYLAARSLLQPPGRPPVPALHDSAPHPKHRTEQDKA